MDQNPRNIESVVRLWVLKEEKRLKAERLLSFCRWVPHVIRGSACVPLKGSDQSNRGSVLSGDLSGR